LVHLELHTAHRGLPTQDGGQYAIDGARDRRVLEASPGNPAVEIRDIPNRARLVQVGDLARIRALGTLEPNVPFVGHLGVTRGPVDQGPALERVEVVEVPFAM